MSLKSNEVAGRRARRWPIVAGLVLLSAVYAWLLLGRAQSPPAPHLAPQLAAAQVETTEGLAELAPGDEPESAPGEAERAPREAPPARLLCLRSVDRTPLAGISLFAGAESLAGPSGADGVLEFRRPRARRLTIWAPGWSPVFVRGFEETPEVVLLEACQGRLELRLLGMQPGDEVVRSLLQPRAFVAEGEDPWQPALVPDGLDRLVAEQLPPGAYDAYVWVARNGEEARVLSAPAVEVPGQGSARIELNADVLPAPEPDR